MYVHEPAGTPGYNQYHTAVTTTHDEHDEQHGRHMTCEEETQQ